MKIENKISGAYLLLRARQIRASAKKIVDKNGNDLCVEEKVALGHMEASALYAEAAVAAGGPNVDFSIACLEDFSYGADADYGAGGRSGFTDFDGRINMDEPSLKGQEGESPIDKVAPFQYSDFPYFGPKPVSSK